MYDRSSRAPAIYAHRGSSIMAPENTLPAYEWALEHGSDVLETDIRLSRDGCLFMFHDEHLERTTDGNGRVADTMSSSLKRLNAAAHFARPGEQLVRPWRVSLLTLEELFASYPAVRINIDIKDNSKDAANELIRLIEQFGRYELTTVGSFYRDVMVYLRNKAPTIRTAAVKEEVAQIYFGRFAGPIKPDCAKPVDAKTRPQPFEALQIPTSWHGIRLATPAFVRFGQQLGYEMVYWTINDEHTMKRLQSIGVDGVVTDRPDIAHQVFTGKKLTAN